MESFGPLDFDQVLERVLEQVGQGLSAEVLGAPEELERTIMRTALIRFQDRSMLIADANDLLSHAAHDHSRLTHLAHLRMLRQGDRLRGALQELRDVTIIRGGWVESPAIRRVAIKALWRGGCLYFGASSLETRVGALSLRYDPPLPYVAALGMRSRESGLAV